MLNRGIKTVSRRLGGVRGRRGGPRWQFWKCDNDTQPDHGVLPAGSLTFGPKLFTHDRLTDKQRDQGAGESGINRTLGLLWNYCLVYIATLGFRLHHRIADIRPSVNIFYQIREYFTFCLAGRYDRNVVSVGMIYYSPLERTFCSLHSHRLAGGWREFPWSAITSWTCQRVLWISSSPEVKIRESDTLQRNYQDSLSSGHDKVVRKSRE